MASELEETLSDSSYDYFVSRPKLEDIEVSSGICSEDVSDVGSKAVNAGVKAASATESKAWTRDDKFFFFLVTFRVEDKLFRVPREAFEKRSEFFRDMFAAKLETASQGAQEVNSEGHPIFLEGVEKGAFRDFLFMLYPPSRTPTNWFPLTCKQWTSILHLAHLWKFKDIRSLAVQELRAVTFEEVEKVELALKYGIVEWYADAYLALAKRTQPLTVEEGKRLGLDLSLKMAQIRERRLARMMAPQRTEPDIAAQPAAGFAPYGGSYAPFGTSAPDKPQPSEAFGIPTGAASPFPRQTASGSSIFGVPIPSGVQDTTASSGGPSLLFGKTVFGYPTPATAQAGTSTTSSDSPTFSFGGTSNKKSPSYQAEKGTGIGRLNVDKDDIQLKKDIKDVFGL